MKLVLLLFMAAHLINPNKFTDLIKIRNLYEQAAIKEEAQLKFEIVLNKIESNTALIDGYKGANLMVSAKYVFSPLSKMSKFAKGKKLIEDAIKIEPNNIELRYIRFTLQTNLPNFLGYNSCVEKDKAFMIDQLLVMTDVDLRKRVVAYLLLTKSCNESELKSVLEWKNK